MRNILVIGLVALSLGGCVNGKILGFIPPLGAVANPVSTQALATMEAAYGAALSGAVTFKRLCIAKQYNVVGPDCRAIVLYMQQAGKYAQAQVLVARDFVKKNPTVDATAIINTAQQAIAAFKASTPSIKGP